MPSSAGASAFPPELRASLDQARTALLSVHKALLDDEKIRYEKHRGPIATPGHFLQLLIHDDWFAWLHPLTELVVQIDELVFAKEPQPRENADALLEQARRLLSPSESGDPFQRHYFQTLQRAPAVVMAHAEAQKLVARRH